MTNRTDASDARTECNARLPGATTRPAEPDCAQPAKPKPDMWALWQAERRDAGN